MTEDNNFCTRCGHSLSGMDKFCPECGFRVPGRNPEQEAKEIEALDNALDTRVKWAGYLMLAYSIPFLIMGIWVLVDQSYIIDTLWGYYQDYAGVTEAELEEFVRYAGYMYIVSSVAGIASAVFCIKKKMFWIALVLCMVSMLTGVAGFLSLFMGLIALWIILTSKPVFDGKTAKDLIEESY